MHTKHETATRDDLAFGLRALAEAIWELATAVELGEKPNRTLARMAKIAGIVHEARLTVDELVSGASSLDEVVEAVDAEIERRGLGRRS